VNAPWKFRDHCLKELEGNTDAQGVFRQMLECAQSPDGWKNGGLGIMGVQRL